MLDVNRYETQAYLAIEPIVDIDLNAPPENRARIVPAQGVAAGEWYWMATLVHQLSSEENGGNHHVYLVALDENGWRDEDTWIEWGWEGKRPDEPAPTFRLSGKPATEPAGNISMQWNQRVRVRIYGEKSDQVENLNIMLPWTGPKAYQGHQSHLVIFTRRRKGGQPGPVPQPGDEGRAMALIDVIHELIESYLAGD